MNILYNAFQWNRSYYNYLVHKSDDSYSSDDNYELMVSIHIYTYLKTALNLPYIHIKRKTQ